jgi:hypothetical protein
VAATLLLTFKSRVGEGETTKMATLVTAIKIWGLASFVIFLGLNVFQYRLRNWRYYSRWLAMISTLISFVAQLVVVALN